MKNSLRISTFIVALVIVVAGVQSSFASPTRMNALGMDSTSYWMLQKDTTTTAYFPSYGVQFPALMAITAGDASPSASIFLKPAENMELWLYSGGALSDGTGTVSATNFAGLFINAPAAMVTGNAASKVDISRETYAALFAMKMGNMGIGLKYGASDSSSVTKASDSTAATSSKADYAKAIQYVLAGFDMDMGAMGVDLGLKYTMYDFAGKTSALLASGDTTSQKYAAAPSDTSIFARFNMALSEISKMHVFLGYTMLDRGDKLTDNSVTGGVSSTTVNKSTHTGTVTMIGASNEMKFAQNAFAYFGFLYTMAAYDIKNSKAVDGVVDPSTKYTVAQDTFKVYMGTQAQLTKNLSGIVGMQRVWDVTSSTKAKTTTSTTVQKNDVDTVNPTTTAGSTLPVGSWGLLYNWGHFTIEAKMTTDVLRKGPWFVSGTANDMAASVNIVYAFGKQANFDDEKK